MLFEVSKEAFEKIVSKLDPNAIVLAQYVVQPEQTFHRSESAPPKGSAPGTQSALREWDETVAEHVTRVLILTNAASLIYQPTEMFETDFVTKLLPAATLVGSIHG